MHVAKGLIEPRVLKGFRDTLPAVALERSRMIRTLEGVFSSFGFTPIDTPALEYAEILLGKGSEETDRQLYRFTDQGGRDIALRFDLTVPLARFVAEHANELGMPFRRYHIAPVWRAEKPQRGRYREFIQCDFDIIGSESLLGDAEVLGLVSASLGKLGIDHELRVNNRLILNGLLETVNAGGTAALVLRAVDKLDKLGAEVVKAELREQGGLDDAQIATVFAYLALSASDATPTEVLRELDGLLAKSATGTAGVQALRTLFAHASEYGLAGRMLQLDLSIARGLDYYTGMVFETRMVAMPAIGSICSGGRYDNLVNLYSNRRLPGVGGSIGLDRIFGALEELKQLDVRTSPAQVFVAVGDDSCIAGAISIAQSLRQAGHPTELSLEAGSLGAQFKYADRRGIGLAVIFGERERLAGTCGVKNLKTGEQVNDISLTGIAAEITRRLTTLPRP
ncbi:MAG: histidine--tRNA ligase [Deltaproteobacteria bacterium]|nr:histidine--tRNA ligase [Deltaproteobacteria bacterium]